MRSSSVVIGPRAAAEEELDVQIRRPLRNLERLRLLLFASVIEGSESMGKNGAVSLCSAVISCAFIEVKAVGRVRVKHLACESPAALKKCKAKCKALTW